MTTLMTRHAWLAFACLALVALGMGCDGDDDTVLIIVIDPGHIAKDLNGDRIPDLIVGAPTGGPNGEGQVLVYHGPPPFSATPDVILTGENAGDAFGVEVDAHSDLNGDRIADLVVGGPNAAALGGGRVYIFYGKVGGITSQPAVGADAVIDGDVDTTFFGSQVTTGDINGDGVGDVIASDPLAFFNQGRVYIFYGVINGVIDGPTSGDANTIITGDPTDILFGGFPAPLDDIAGDLTTGDVNGDGIDDLLVGSPEQDTNFEGLVHVFLGRAGGFTNRESQTAEMILDAAGVGIEFGHAIAVVDVNGDAIGDIVVSDVDGGPGGEGEVYVFFGSGAPSNRSIATADATITGEAVGGEHFGGSLAGGRVDRDGFTDLAVGDPLFDGPLTANADDGRVYVFLGGAIAGPMGAGTADVIVDGDIDIGVTLANVTIDFTSGTGDNGDDYDEDGFEVRPVNPTNHFENQFSGPFFSWHDGSANTPPNIIRMTPTAGGTFDVISVEIVDNPAAVGGIDFRDSFANTVTAAASFTGTMALNFTNTTFLEWQIVNTGNNTFPVSIDNIVLIASVPSQENVGRAVALCDMDRDLLADLLIGAARPAQNSSAVHVFFGSGLTAGTATSTSLADETVQDTSATGSRFGWSLSRR